MQIDIILVEPFHPENIGASARAIKTMGISNLVLINPRKHLSEPALWMAHGANEVLHKAVIHKTFDEIIDKYDILIGTSAKKRSIKNDYLSSEKLPEFINNKKEDLRKIAIIFGREDRGLENNELSKCDIISYIPLQTKYPSLNLSQSVMIYSYLVSSFLLNQNRYLKQSDKNESEFINFKAKTKKLLQKTDLDTNKLFYNRIIERTNYLQTKDIKLLQKLLNRILEKLP